MDLKKVEAVMSWERLKSVFKIRSFLGYGGGGLLQEVH